MRPRRCACQFVRFKKCRKNRAILGIGGRLPVNELFIMPNHFEGLNFFSKIFKMTLFRSIASGALLHDARRYNYRDEIDEEMVEIGDFGQFLAIFS